MTAGPTIRSRGTTATPESGTSGRVAPRPRGPRRVRRAPLVLPVRPERAREHLIASIATLRDEHPEYSAFQTTSERQRKGAAIGGVLLLVLLVLFTTPTLVAIAAFFTVLYAGAVTYRLICFRRGLDGGTIVQISDEEALAADPRLLPRYSVLVPAYKEPEVIAKLLTNLGALDYPRDRLEILILLEEDDRATLDAVREAKPPEHVRVVLVPPSEPKTKPKACNYGLQLARGDIVTIFDAEDRPEPLQLRRAAVAFRRLPPDIVCLQAQLGYFNADQNIITQWFTAEYVTWFAHFLPGLVALQAPVPLGGTSNHMSVAALRELGAWDPYNVTEDADLGMRLHRLGLRTAVINSVTLEEANSDFVNWAKQRSRWYKGYLQTWLVHLREPRRLRRELGWRGFVGFNLFVGGTPILAALNPIFWSATVVWFVAKPRFIEAAFPTPWYYLALASWLLGNFAIVYMNVVSVREADRPDLLLAAILSPVYWVMMAVAAVKAFVQLVQQPSFWEKTTHGLFQDTQTEAQTDEADRRALA